MQTRRPQAAAAILLALATFQLFHIPASAQRNLAAANPITVPYWKDLSSPQYLWGAEGAIYYSFPAPNGTKVHLIVIDTKSDKWRIKPILNQGHATTSSCAETRQSSAAVNGGYFNLKDGLSASYIVIDGKTVADPTTNKALINNESLKPFLTAIFDRSELRILEDHDHKIQFQIARHTEPLPPDSTLLHSLQAGPRLLPAVTSREEAFLRTDPNGKVFDGISSLKPAARTAFGITSDGYAMLVCAASAKQDPESHGLTLAQLADLMKSLGCAEAMNLDGGTSTTMFIRNASDASPAAKEPPAGRIVCGHTPETFVRSVLTVEPSGR
jgi:hypothetical protein